MSKNTKLKNFKSSEDYINLYLKLIHYNTINTIVTYKNGSNKPFYGSLKSYLNKKQSLSKKIFNDIDSINNKVFNNCFQIPTEVFEKLFGTRIINGKRTKLFPYILKQIKNNPNSPIVVYNCLIKNKKINDKYENVLDVANRYVVKDEVLRKLFENSNTIKEIIDLESGHYTSDEIVAIRTFLKIRHEVIETKKQKWLEKQCKKHDENIVVNTTKTITKEKPIETKPIEEINKKLNSNTTKETIILNTQKETKKKEVKMRTKKQTKIKQPKYDDIPDEPETKQNNNKEFITKLQKYVDDYIFSHNQLNDLLKALKEKPILIKGTKGDFTNDDRLKNLNNRIKLLERVIKHKNIQKNIEQKAYWTNIIKNDIYDLKKQIEKQKADKEYEKQLKAKSIVINEKPTEEIQIRVPNINELSASEIDDLLDI